MSGIERFHCSTFLVLTFPRVADLVTEEGTLLPPPGGAVTPFSFEGETPGLSPSLVCSLGVGGVGLVLTGILESRPEESRDWTGVLEESRDWPGVLEESRDWRGVLLLLPVCYLEEWS